MSRLFSIDPVGILKACTTNVRMKSARMTAIRIDSKYSRTVDFLKSVIIYLLAGPHISHALGPHPQRSWLRAVARSSDAAQRLRPLSRAPARDSSGRGWGPRPH